MAEEANLRTPERQGASEHSSSSARTFHSCTRPSGAPDSPTNQRLGGVTRILEYLPTTVPTVLLIQALEERRLRQEARMRGYQPGWFMDSQGCAHWVEYLPALDVALFSRSQRSPMNDNGYQMPLGFAGYGYLRPVQNQMPMNPEMSHFLDMAFNPNIPSPYDMQQPMHQQPVHQQPMNQHPVYQQPMHQQPMHQQPPIFNMPPNYQVPMPPSNYGYGPPVQHSNLIPRPHRMISRDNRDMQQHWGNPNILPQQSSNNLYGAHSNQSRGNQSRGRYHGHRNGRRGGYGRRP